MRKSLERNKVIISLCMIIIIAVIATFTGCGEKTVTSSTTLTSTASGTTVTTTASGTTVTSSTTVTSTVSSTTKTTTKPPKDKIVVGMARPLSGWNATIGDSAFRPIYETWVPEVNAAGGIYVEEYGKKLPIELIIYDDTSDVNTCVKLTEKLITQDKVDFLWPASGTAFLFAQAPIANKYGYVLLTAEGGATTLRDAMPGFPYLFVSLSFSDWYQVPVFADMLAAKGAKTAYIVAIADLHGIEYAGMAVQEFNRAGIQIVGNVSVPGDLKDWSNIINDAKSSGADIFFCECYPDGVMGAIGTSMALNYNPKAWLGGPGANFGFFHTAFGEAVEGVMCWASWNDKTSPAFAELANKLYSGKPEEVHDWWGHSFYWASVDAWKAAIEKAGTLDQDVIRNVLAHEHVNTVLGETWFELFGDGGGFLAKETHPGEVGQWINGKCEIVGGGNWPATKLTADFVYPKPPWPGQ